MAVNFTSQNGTHWVYSDISCDQFYNLVAQTDYDMTDEF